MRRLGPDDRLAVAAHDDVEPLADRRHAIVAGAQLPELDAVAHAHELVEPGVERLPLACRVGLVHALGDPQQRTPVAHFLDVFEEQDARPHLFGPVRHHPRQVAHRLADRPATLGLGMMPAIGREPAESDADAVGDAQRVDPPDVVRQVQRVRMVDPMHGDRRIVVIDGDRHMLGHIHPLRDQVAQRLLDAFRRAAAAGEAVDDQLVRHGLAARRRKLPEAVGQDRVHAAACCSLLRPRGADRPVPLPVRPSLNDHPCTVPSGWPISSAIRCHSMSAPRPALRIGSADALV